MTVAVIGIGTSAAPRVKRVEEAVAHLREQAGLTVLATAAFFKNAAWGGATVATFVNTAVAVQTPLAPLAFLGVLQAIERRLGRVRGTQNACRTLDLDLLWMQGVRMNHPRLTLPHPGLPERATAQIPLLDVLGQLGLAPFVGPAQPSAAALVEIGHKDAPGQQRGRYL